MISTAFIMRTLCFALLVLLALEVSCTSIFKGPKPKGCCVPNIKALKWENILSYETDKLCVNKTYIVRIKDKQQVERKLCADPTKGFVIAAIEKFENKTLKRQ